MLQSESSPTLEQSSELSPVTQAIVHDPNHHHFNFDRWAIRVRSQMIASLRKRNHFETVDDLRTRRT